MTRIILSGANGVMGCVIAENIRGRNDCKIVAGIDLNTESREDFPIFSSAADCDVPADVIVDFSHPLALAPLIAFAENRKLPIVVATTGLSAGQIETIKETSQKLPVFFSFNMSLGVNLMVALAKTAAQILGDGFDIEIIEKHHNKKIDAPSGTALMLADGIKEALKDEPQYVYERHSKRSPRTQNEIGIHAIRGGTIVGEHDVLFAGKDEILSISHSARSKHVFATGAVNAAIFLANKAPGLYSMSDLIGGEKTI